LHNETEMRLLFWRDGSTQAERLAAAALGLLGYEEIEPQSPLGGPDGKKDILCQKAGKRWIAAVHFPGQSIGFPATLKKMKSDLAGAPNGFDGFVFVTNQSLSLPQQGKLKAIIEEDEKEADIVHLQRLRTALDSPAGYGVRIQYLRIGMTIEEQLSWVCDADNKTSTTLQMHIKELRALRSSVDRLNRDQSHILSTLGLGALAQSAPTPDMISSSLFVKNDEFGSVTGSIDPAMITMFHRLICFDLPSHRLGQIRNISVWIGDGQGRRAEHFLPPEPQEVPALLYELCSSWRKYFSAASEQEVVSPYGKLSKIGEFHQKFLSIHPFLDGNGRVAKAILMQQCLDLFKIADLSVLDKGAAYYAALKAADGGDIEGLVNLLKPVVGL